MNRKELIIILVALVVLGGAGALLLKHNNESRHKVHGKQGQQLLANFQVNDVASLRIKGQTEVNLVRKDDVWRVQERDGYPANFKDISEFLLKLADLKITQSEPIGQTQLPRMELSEPGSGPKAATLVELKDSKGSVLQSILLGKQHSRGGDGTRGESFPDGRYVLLRSDMKNLLLVPDSLAGAEAKPEPWIEKDFFKVEKPQSISMVTTNVTNNWKISRATETNDWTLADTKPGEILDKNKVSAITSSLSNPSFMDVAVGTNVDMKTPEVVTVETFDHFTYVIKVGGHSPDGNGYLNVSVTATPSKERVPGKDEKPEDKTKLDKEFNDHAKQQQEKLAKEQAEGKWNYIVAAWTLEGLTHPRNLLLEEKKEDKKPDDAAAPTALPK